MENLTIKISDYVYRRFEIGKLTLKKDLQLTFEISDSQLELIVERSDDLMIFDGHLVFPKTEIEKLLNILVSKNFSNVCEKFNKTFSFSSFKKNDRFSLRRTVYSSLSNEGLIKKFFLDLGEIYNRKIDIEDVLCNVRQQLKTGQDVEERL